MSDEIILSRLEDWRKRHGLKKTDMANILRLKQSQNYTNWIARRSIPKEYMLHVSRPSTQHPNSFLTPPRPRPERGFLYLSNTPETVRFK